MNSEHPYISADEKILSSSAIVGMHVLSELGDRHGKVLDVEDIHKLAHAATRDIQRTSAILLHITGAAVLTGGGAVLTVVLAYLAATGSSGSLGGMDVTDAGLFAATSAVLGFLCHRAVRVALGAAVARDRARMLAACALVTIDLIKDGNSPFAACTNKTPEDTNDSK